MNFKVIASLLLVSSTVATAQDFQGKAVYQTKVALQDLPEKSINNTEEFEKEQISKGVKELMEKQRTYILDFNKTESIYKEDETLIEPVRLSNGMVMKMTSSGFGRKYKNLKNQTQISEEEILNKMFLVEEKLPVWNWILTNETKKIGNYSCLKATDVIPVSEQEMKAYETKVKEEETKKTNFLKTKPPSESMIVVWYTPEIPVSHGPENYWGLPGLILEANDGETIMLCSKIILNSKEIAEIKQPQTGAKVSREKFIETEKEKMLEMKERHNSKN